MHINKKLLSSLLGYFIKGALLVVPFAATIYITLIALNWIDSLIKIKIPGLGMGILLISITLLGYLGSTVLFKSFLDNAEKIITKLPFVSVIYYPLKELTSAFVGNDKKFNQPVLVLINKETQLHKLGFITQKELEAINLTGNIAVYVPHSYNFSGDLFILPREVVKPLNVSSAGIMKFIISGGVTGLRSHQSG